MAGAPLMQRVTGFQKKRKRRQTLRKLYASIVPRPPKRSGPALTQSHYRRAADTIIEENGGNLLWANGIDPMLRFTPAISTLENAGVIAPSGPISLSGSGTGGITGTFTAYCRYIDRDGNPSSLNAISNTYVASILGGSITGATFTSPIVVTVSGPVPSANSIVKIQNVLGNTAANGTWAVGSPSGSTFQLLNGDGSASVANGTYIASGTYYTGVQTINYDNVPTPTEAKVVRRQILRNQDGESSVYYIDIDTTDLTSSSFRSSTPSLALANPVSLFDINGHSLVDKALPLNYKKIICTCLGRVFAAGVEPYSEGAIALTNGSAAVTGIGTEWGPLTFNGRLLTVVGGNKTYVIQQVYSTTSLALSEVYSGTTDPYAYYTISPADPLGGTNLLTERRTFYWSEPQQPEAWPVVNQSTLEEDPGAGEITGLMTMGPFLYILAQSRIYNYSFVANPLLDGFSTKAARRGCINNRCWIQSEGSAYMLDYRGIHIFSGNDDRPVGSIEIQDLFRPRQTGPYKINWNAVRQFHAVFDPGETIVRWFVTMQGSYTPQHALAYHVRMNRWWIEYYPFPVASSCLGRMNGKPQVYLGSDAKKIYALNASSLDGLDPNTGTVRGTVTSAGINWIKDSTATFPSSNVVGAPLTIIGGTGKYQSQRIISVSGTQLNVAYPWNVRPDTTSVYQIGGVSWKWKSGWRMWAPDADNSVRAVHITSKPTQSANAMALRVYQDFATTPNTYDTTQSRTTADGNGIAYVANDPATDLTIDTTKTNGYVWTRLDTFREEYTDAPRFMAIELTGTTNGEAQSIRALRIDGAK